MSDESPQSSLFDLQGLSPVDAKDYILHLTAHWKQTEADLVTLDTEIQLWENRVALAQSHQKLDLQTQAEAQLAELRQKRASRATEAAEFQAGIERLKKQLTLLPLTQRTIDPQALLERLEKISGPLDTVTPMTRQWEADEALTALKKRLQDGN